MNREYVFVLCAKLGAHAGRDHSSKILHWYEATMTSDLKTRVDARSHEFYAAHFFQILS